MCSPWLLFNMKNGFYFSPRKELNHLSAFDFFAPSFALRRAPNCEALTKNSYICDSKRKFQRYNKNIRTNNAN